jgi:hypothetical protein
MKTQVFSISRFCISVHGLSICKLNNLTQLHRLHSLDINGKKNIHERVLTRSVLLFAQAFKYSIESDSYEYMDVFRG